MKGALLSVPLFAAPMLFAEGTKGDALLDTVASSGPATGAVVVLAFLIKTWLGSVLTEIASIKGKVETLGNTDASLRVDVAELRIELRAANKRIENVERGRERERGEREERERGERRRGERDT